jgi:hypothetical protein
LTAEFKVLNTVKGTTAYQRRTPLGNKAQHTDAGRAKLASEERNIIEFTAVARHRDEMQLCGKTNREGVAHRGFCALEAPRLSRN